MVVIAQASCITQASFACIERVTVALSLMDLNDEHWREFAGSAAREVLGMQPALSNHRTSLLSGPSAGAAHENLGRQRALSSPQGQRPQGQTSQRTSLPSGPSQSIGAGGSQSIAADRDRGQPRKAFWAMMRTMSQAKGDPPQTLHQLMARGALNQLMAGLPQVEKLRHCSERFRARSRSRGRMAMPPCS